MPSGLGEPNEGKGGATVNVVDRERNRRNSDERMRRTLASTQLALCWVFGVRQRHENDTKLAKLLAEIGATINPNVTSVRRFGWRRFVGGLKGVSISFETVEQTLQ